MNKDKALESVNEIKELMEKSSKFISFSGLAAIMAGIYALVGAYTSYYTRHKVEHSFGTNDHSSFTCIDSLRCHCLYPFLL